MKKFIPIGIMLLILWGIHSTAMTFNYFILKATAQSVTSADMIYANNNKNKMFAIATSQETLKPKLNTRPVQPRRVISVEVDTDEKICLARNIYHEARNQGIEGMYAVAYVTINRMKIDAYPNSICKVVYQGERD